MTDVKVEQQLERLTLDDNQQGVDGSLPTKVVVEKKILASKVTGIVKWFNVKSGYGFITRDDTNEDIFIHQSSIIKNNPNKYKKSVGETEKLEFDIVQGEKGDDAANVTGPNGEPVVGSKYAGEKKQRKNRYRRNRKSKSNGGDANDSNPSGGDLSGNQGVEGGENNSGHDQHEDGQVDGEKRKFRKKRIVRRRPNPNRPLKTSQSDGQHSQEEGNVNDSSNPQQPQKVRRRYYRSRNNNNNGSGNNNNNGNFNNSNGGDERRPPRARSFNNNMGDNNNGNQQPMGNPSMAHRLNFNNQRPPYRPRMPQGQSQDHFDMVGQHPRGGNGQQQQQMRGNGQYVPRNNNNNNYNNSRGGNSNNYSNGNGYNTGRNQDGGMGGMGGGPRNRGGAPRMGGGGGGQNFRPSNSNGYIGSENRKRVHSQN